MSKTIGVIGLGSIGMRHAINLIEMGNAVYGVEPDENRMADFVDGGGMVLDRQSVDAYVIASPTSQHHYALFQLGEHLPLFVEKPIADRLPVARANVVMVGYMLRWHSCVKQAREWLAAGDIGTPLWATLTCAQFNDRPAYLRDGVILNWSHEIDLALYLLGPAHVSAAAARIKDGCDDIADILLEHESGARSTIHLDYVTRPEIRQTLIVGSEGQIVLDLVSRHAWLRDTDGGILEHFQGVDSFDKNYVEEMQAFIDRIDGKDTLGATGEDGLAALQICLDARKMAGVG